MECLEDFGGIPWKTLLAEPFEAILQRKNADKIAVVSAYRGEFHAYQFVIDCLIASFRLFVAFFVPPVDAQPNAKLAAGLVNRGAAYWYINKIPQADSALLSWIVVRPITSRWSTSARSRDYNEAIKLIPSATALTPIVARLIRSSPATSKRFADESEAQT